MHTLLRIMQNLACIIVLMTVILMWVEAWQKKYDKEHANTSKEYKKMLRRFFWCSLGALIASNLMLYLKMY